MPDDDKPNEPTPRPPKPEPIRDQYRQGNKAIESPAERRDQRPGERRPRPDDAPRRDKEQ